MVANHPEFVGIDTYYLSPLHRIFMDVKHPTLAAVRLPALLALLLFTSATPSVCAQRAILRAPRTLPRTFKNRADATQLPAADDVLPHTPARDECADCVSQNYWIVSSRHCQQERRNFCPRCALDFHHVGSNGQQRRTDQQEFLGSLDPSAPVCILVHGSFATWDGVKTGSTELYEWLRAAAPHREPNVVFFTWPSDQPNTMLLQFDMAILGRRSARHGIHLSRLISLIPADRPVSLVGHSHGARTVASALHLRSGGKVQGYHFGRAADLGRRIRVVFAAAAIDNHWLNPGERYGLAMRGTEYLVNLTSREDIALSFYPLRRLFSHEALARTGFTQKNRKALGRWTAKLGEIDVTSIIKRGHFWHSYVTHPQIATSIAPILFYNDGKSTQSAHATRRQVRQMSGTQAASSYVTQPLRETYSHIRRDRPGSRQ